ncbi:MULTISPECIES: acylphosphatase [Arthrobacter]|uniref:acylphosphatase n=2 Tax=Arthrobacter TaxID=1663 RepID=A0ABU9KP71_9MICC|nr:acylphosphatase [Arthrobacter sp. YJM1]MDP5228711.1 acylphosphatase [Arthrobacter sp. YJM1]
MSELSGMVSGIPVRLHAIVSGTVQGVGFRYWTRAEAEGLGLTGGVGNLPDGTVEVIAEGTRDAVTDLLDWLRSGDTPGRVGEVEAQLEEPSGGFPGFSVW